MLSVKLLDSIDERWQIEEKLGSGTYAKVYLARPQVEGFPDQVAIKCYRQTCRQDMGLCEALVRELALMRRHSHPNLLALYEVCYSDGTINAVLEYMPFTLEKVIDSDDHPKTWQTVSNVVHQLLIALEFLHSWNVVHRDLSVGNVFLDTDQLEHATVKLGDFNLSKIVSNDMTPGMVTLNYRSPELLCEKISHYGTEIDMWACGCVASELLRGAILFDGSCEDDVLATIFGTLGMPDRQLARRIGLEPRRIQRQVDRVKSLLAGRKLADRLYTQSSQALSLCSGLLKIDPKQRLTAKQALALF